MRDLLQRWLDQQAGRRLISVLFLLLGATASAGEKVRLANGDWPPYCDPALPEQGIGSRIIREAFRQSGIDVEYVFLPWKRGYELAKAGALDGTILWSKLPEREPHFWFSDVVIDSRVVLFHRLAIPLNWRTMDDLRGLRVGYTNGYDYAPAFKRFVANKGNRAIELPSDENGVQSLLSQRIDVYPLDDIVGRYLLDRYASKGWQASISFQPKALSEDQLHLLLSKRQVRNVQLLRRFNEGLAKLHASGQYAAWMAEVRPSKAP